MTTNEIVEAIKDDLYTICSLAVYHFENLGLTPAIKEIRKKHKNILESLNKLEKADD